MENTLPTMTLAEIESRLRDAEIAIAEEHQRHTDEINRLQQGKRALAERRALMFNGLDVEKIGRAKEIIYTRGSFLNAGEDRHAQRRDAISDLLKGAPELRERYFGTKDYAQWHGQGTNHTYGYGPKHGSIIFEIGLHPVARQRELTPEEIDDALYYLSRLEDIELAKVGA